ncbi:YdcF family protein [Streptomyces sp. NPDC057644]|uniref:YdcF family protein n=1 Tax=Streptomyces sp. NPDC057644 TaxID=3346191 RepID=UPI0036761D77
MTPITGADRGDARILWDFNVLKQPVRPCPAALALGGCDIGVATAAADLYRARLFPVVVFSGGIMPGTCGRFPRGEAVHFRERAVALGVPEEIALLEPHATNTGENISFGRKVLTSGGRTVPSVLLISMPYMQRRAYATCRKQWPEVDPVCASQPVSFDEYAEAQDDEAEFIAMMMGDTHRVMEYPRRGFAIEQEVPDHVRDAFERLRRRGYDTWLLPD